MCRSLLLGLPALQSQPRPCRTSCTRSELGLHSGLRPKTPWACGGFLGIQEPSLPLFSRSPEAVRLQIREAWSLPP